MHPHGQHKPYIRFQPNGIKKKKNYFFLKYKAKRKCIYQMYVPLRFSGNATNLRQTAFSWKQWCCSANANVVATVLIATSSQRLASQSNLSLSKPYRSAAANRCWDINVDAHFEFNPVSSSISGSVSQYIKWSRAFKLNRQNKMLV